MAGGAEPIAASIWLAIIGGAVVSAVWRLAPVLLRRLDERGLIQAAAGYLDAVPAALIGLIIGGAILLPGSGSELGGAGDVLLRLAFVAAVFAGARWSGKSTPVFLIAAVAWLVTAVAV